MSFKSCIRKIRKVEASTHELEILLSTQLKLNIGATEKNVEQLGIAPTVAINPQEGVFYANICEPEDYKGRFYVCKDPCYFVGVSKFDSTNWKLIFCRKICDKYGKAGTCRRALIRVAYLG